MLVEPPEGSSFVVTAYVPGTVEPNELAWVQPNDPTSGHGQEHVELSKLPRISTAVRCTNAADREQQGLLGVVYADSPVAYPSDSAHSLASVSVAVSGLVTLVHPHFKEKKQQCTCSDVVYARVPEALEAGLPELKVQRGIAAAPGGGWVRVGRLMEIGSMGDARILL